MKAAQQHSTTGSRTPAKSRPQNRPAEPYLSLAETRSMLSGAASLRQKRLDASDMISTNEAAELARTSRVTINAWIKKGRAVGLTQSKRGYRMPSWQFDSPLWDVIPALSRALGTTEGWALLTFLETPLGGLDGATPRSAIERGNATRVMELAARDT